MESKTAILFSELENIQPVSIPDVLLICPGNWNEVDYTGKELKKAFELTDWEDKSNTHLYLDHQDTQKRGVGNWAGYVKNIRLIGNDLYGDLELWNLQMATYLKAAKAKFGISATLKGMYNEKSNTMENFRYESFSIVTEPACAPAYINLSKEKELNANEKEISVTLGKLDLSLTQLKGGLKNNMLKEEKKLEEESKEEPVEEVKEEPKEESESKEAPEEKKEEVEEEKSDLSANGLKELSTKVDALTEKLSAFVSAFEKSLQSEEKVEEAPKEEAKEEVVEEKEDELAKVQKELAALQEKVNAPVSKTLSSSSGASNADPNVGMLNFLKRRV